MRVAIFTRGFGGAFANVASALARGFLGVGEDVHIVAAAKSGDVDPFRFPGRASYTWLGKRPPAGAIVPLARYLRRSRPDVLIALGRSQNLTAVAAQELSRWKGTLLLSEHSLKGVEDNPADRSSWGFRRQWLTPRLFYRRAHGVAVVATDIGDFLRAYSKLPERVPIELIPNPVDVETLRRKAEAEVHHPWILDRSSSVVLSVGRLVPFKNQGLLIDAFALLRETHDARLLIIGEGPSREALQEKIDDLELEGYVELPGRTSNPVRYMSRADVFAMTSLREGASLVVLEAMSAGCPVVVTRSEGGLVDVVEGGRSGTVVPLDDARALGDAIARILDDPDHRRALVAAGEQRVDQFTPEKVALRWLDFAERVRRRP